LTTVFAALLLHAGTASAEPTIYWTEIGSGTTPAAVRYLDPRTGATVTIDRGPGHQPAGGPTSLDGVTLDVAAGKVLWTRFDQTGPRVGTGSIWRANLDGTGAATLVTGLGPPGGARLNVAADPLHEYAYWTTTDSTTGAGMVNRVPYAGGTAQVIASTEHDTYPDPIVVDPVGGYVYWGQQDGLLRRARLDGSDPQTLRDYGELGSGPSGLALDTAAGKLYVSLTNRRLIERVDLDGGNPQNAFATDGDRPFGLALDAEAGRLYWADLDGGRIRSALLNGTAVRTEVQGLVGPRAVALLPEPGPAALACAASALLVTRRRRR
jgi:DNA-binding beta-propeller fold protein YncE